MNSSLAVRVVETEIRLGYLFVPAAESAYKLQDFVRAHEAKNRGQAAYFRANRLLAHVAEGGREALATDLKYLQSALNGLFSNTGICALNTANPR